MVWRLFQNRVENDAWLGDNAIALLPHCSSSFYQPCYRDQNDRADEGHNDRTNHAASRPDAKHSEEPAAQNPAEDAQNDVDEYAVTAAFHHLASEPTCDQSDYDPR